MIEFGKKRVVESENEQNKETKTQNSWKIEFNDREKRVKMHNPIFSTEQNEFNSRELIDVMFFAPIEIGELKLINDISEVLFHKIKH